MLKTHFRLTWSFRCFSRQSGTPGLAAHGWKTQSAWHWGTLRAFPRRGTQWSTACMLDVCSHNAKSPWSAAGYHLCPSWESEEIPGMNFRHWAGFFQGGREGEGKEDVPGKCGPQPQSSPNSSRRHPSVNLKDDLIRLYNRSLYRLIVIPVKLPVYCGVAELCYVTLRWTYIE